MARRTLNGRYELDDLPIGRGGMGEVWVGRDIKLDREVAVKLIRFPDDTPDPDLVARFVRESRITARLEHPGVPAVYDVGTVDQRPFMVMQRVHGITVADLIAEHGPLPVAWAAAIAAQACAVLVAAHGASLVHRDLKPANLMLCPDGTVRVLDFGLAVALGSGDSQITRTGQSLGTPAYMAPELVLAGTTEPATDLYALGCTLYEMLTGRCPFRGSTAYAVMSKQVDEPAPSARLLQADVPDALDALARRLLAKTPADRPASAVDVYDRLLPFVDGVGVLPGALARSTAISPVRMYATVVGRVFPRRMPTVSNPPTAPPAFSRSELRRAREEAASLTRRSQHSEAAGVLAAAAEPATRVLGADDPDVVSLRFELANVRFDGGDFRRAGDAYRELVAVLAPDDELALRCRLQEATCNALAGETDRALTQLEGLLVDERRVHGADDERVLELRKQIGLLQMGTGRHDRAVATFQELLSDAERRCGHDHAITVTIRELLSTALRSGQTMGDA